MFPLARRLASKESYDDPRPPDPVDNSDNYCVQLRKDMRRYSQQTQVEKYFHTV